MFIDGENVYAVYFVPQYTDGNGMAVDSCCWNAVEDARATGLIPATVPGQGRRICEVNVQCKRGCGPGSPGFTSITNGTRITICIDQRVSNSALQTLIIHEMQHARDLCMGGWDTRLLAQCVAFEGRGCEAQCQSLYPTKGPEFDRCNECCVYGSCKHLRGMPVPNPPCELGVPTRPCWKFDPKIPGFLPDPKDPRCPRNRRKRGR